MTPAATTTSSSVLAPCEDSVLAAILWRPADQWTEAEVKQYLSRRVGDGCRVAIADPKCENITHYKRCGRWARYEFKCLLKSRIVEGPAVPFWIPYLDVRALEEADKHLTAKGWIMRNYFSTYSEGEDAWDSGLSGDEELRAKRRRRGRPHEFVKAPRRCRQGK